MASRTDFFDSHRLPDSVSVYLPASDQELIERFRAGQRDAADQLFRRYEATAYRVAAGILGNCADAHDAVQNAFIDALVHLHDFEERSSFENWLWRIVRNSTLNLARKATRRRRLLEKATRSSRTARMPTPLDALAEEELPEVIERILKNRATLLMRQVFEMRLMNDCTFPQIAKTLNVSLSTIKRKMADVVTLLRVELSQRGWSLL